LKRALLPLAVVAGCLIVCGPALAQLALGQYEDEAPLASWNPLGSPPAPSLGLGGAQLARAWDLTQSLANPALLTSLPRLSASVSASYGGASLYRYALVNTGVVESIGLPSVGLFGVDGGGVAGRAGRWAFAAIVAMPESYGRPAIAVGSGGYQLTFSQTGYLRVFHAAVARELPGGLSLGIGVNAAAGRLDRSTVEQSVSPGATVTITDDKSERYHGLYMNAGLTWRATARLTAGLAVRSPYLKKGPATSLIRYEVPQTATDIRIAAEAENAYRQPWVYGLGLSYRLSAAWSLAFDTDYFDWSRYTATFFDEPRQRTFRSVVRAGGGIEYLAPTRFAAGTARIPFRLGFDIDPQPVTTVRTTYLGLSFGTGLELRSVAADISASFGRENGSGRSLRTARIVLTLRYIFRE
jgi:hypothetical protein